MTERPSLEDIKEAHSRISKYINETPVLTCSSIDKMSGATLFFKCENFLKVGAFKARGACNAVLRLSDSEAEHGVATHSSGNHAAALSYAARIRGIPAYIVMPSNAPKIKKAAVKGYGGIITECEPTLKSRESTAAEVVAQTGAALIHPFDNYKIIAGQATAAVELLQETGKLDFILAPVGGGGLVSGSALTAHYVDTEAKVIACEPEKADDAYRSFHEGRIVPLDSADTIADGLRTMLSEKTFDIISRYVHDIVTVSEEEIIIAMRIVWERMKIIIEPSSAVPVAAVLSKKIKVQDKRIGIILSGGNVELDKLPFTR